MELNQCINFMLTRTQQAVFQRFKSSLSPFDITPVQYGILKCLWDEDGQTPGQIAARLALDCSTITGLLDRMENKGVVKRAPDPKDRRALRVVLTSQGKDLREAVEKVVEAENERAMQCLTAEERKLLWACLEKMCAGYNKSAGE